MSEAEVAYQAVRDLSIAGEASVALLCELTHVSRSGYYKWLRRAERPSRVEDEWLCATILEYHLKYKGILGYRRMTMYINRDYGKTYNQKRIRRWMRFLRLQSVIRRKRRRFLRATPEVTAENLLNREFTAEKPNQKWLTDVTEFKYGKDQKAYLSAILDLGDNSIVSYIVGHKNNNDLVFRTFTLAVAENPQAQPLFHSDRGYQYTSRAFRRMLENAGFQQSMSRPGRCLDNGPMEGFWGTLKSEMYVLNMFSTYDELEIAIKEYMEFYNNKRYQAKHKGLAPMEVRNQALAA